MHQCTNAPMHTGRGNGMCALVHSCIGAFVHFSFLHAPSGLSTLNEDQIAERGARLARRDDQEYREYLREEQRSQTGCPTREVVLDQRGQATSCQKACPKLIWIAGRVSKQDFPASVEPVHGMVSTCV